MENADDADSNANHNLHANANPDLNCKLNANLKLILPMVYADNFRDISLHFAHLTSACPHLLEAVET